MTRPQPMLVENLETRQFLSAAPAPQPPRKHHHPAPPIGANLKNEHLTVIGNLDTANTILVSLSADGTTVDVTLNGTAQSFDRDEVEYILVAGGAQADNITVDLGGANLEDPVIIHAGKGDDNISAGGEIDFIYGDGGNDSISAGDGDDRLFASPDGKSSLSGGEGNDTLVGNSANDALDGGAGSNVIQDMKPPATTRHKRRRHHQPPPPADSTTQNPPQGATGQGDQPPPPPPQGNRQPPPPPPPQGGASEYGSGSTTAQPSIFSTRRIV